MQVPKTEKMRITNLGYFMSSRIYNVDAATYQVNRKIYINMNRNMYVDPEYKEVVKRIMMGQDIALYTGAGNDVRIG